MGVRPPKPAQLTELPAARRQLTLLPQTPAAAPAPTSSPAPPPQILPRITIQDTFPLVIREIQEGLHAAEDAWVSCYAEGRPSVHGRVRVTEVEGGGAVELVAREGVEVDWVSDTELRIACAALEIPPTPVHFPLATPAQLRGGLDAFDVSPKGERVVVGGKDGAVRVVELRSGKAVELRGHVGDVRDVAFFPSGEVVLTASSDMGLRVFSATDGSNPRTLLGHTKAVIALAILGIGKTVLSASLDGSLRLWKTSTSTSLLTIRFTQPLTALTVAPSPSPSPSQPRDSTSDIPPNLIAIVAHPNGSASIVDVGLAEPVIRTLAAGKTPLFAVACSSTHLVALGARDGTISLFDISSPSSSDEKPILTFKRGTAPIESLEFDGETLLVGTGDGLPYRVSLGGGDGVVGVVEEFAGIECEGVRVRKRGGNVWVGAADGRLRRYKGQ